MDLSRTLIKDDCLESWQLIGSGGFGHIYKAKHKKLWIDVAVKLLRYNDGSGSSLLREAELMRRGDSPFVLRILGVYEGCPGGDRGTQLGFVMEFMERGSVADLQTALRGPPPWSLAFRISHHISLGMNFLHQLQPPVFHLDLKPSNVLLDNSLNAKLTDFGLAKVAQSASKTSGERDEEIGGTTSYMPPEAFELNSYTPSFSSDIYSFGILLWSIITGKEPYNTVISSLVRFRIPQGDRPDLSAINPSLAAGLAELTELMKSCWSSRPDLRPACVDCVKVTEEVYELHKQKINNDVCAVQNHLDNKDTVSSISNGSLKESSAHSVKPKPAQETACSAMFRPKRSETTSYIYTPSSATGYNPLTKTPANNLRPPVTQRQLSTPGSVSINFSNVTGVQIGNNNSMNINTSNRRRHRTGPPSSGTSSGPQSSSKPPSGL